MIRTNSIISHQIPPARERRAQQLRELWRTKSGKEQVLSVLWKFRSPEQPLGAGESVFDLILDHEFGPERQ